jgi:choline dehydrogenase-like flavoprotein
MQKATKSMGNMLGMVEDQPLWDNRIEFSGKKDANGVPSVHTNYRMSKDALQLIENTRKEGHEVLKLAGSNDIMESPIFSQHMMGGTIMGSNESDSVTDSYGRVHGMQNLYIGGASLFPTSSSVNSTYTIHALADRSARFIAKNWSQIV